MVAAYLTNLLSQQQQPQLIHVKYRYLRKSHQPIYLTEPRPDYSFHYIISGQTEYTWDSGSLTTQPGYIILAAKGSCHDFRAYTELGKIQVVIVYFDIPGGTTLSPMPPQLLCRNASAMFETLFLDVAAAYKTRDNSPYLLKAKFNLLLHHILKLHNPKIDPQLEILEQAKHLLAQNTATTIAQIAAQCCVSESSLRRLFLQHAGLSPVAYRNSVKLQKACDLLISTNLSINEIATMLDYFDSSYFCKQFLKELGCTPTQYRQQAEQLPSRKK